jgi:2-polyprenyl-6-methoxyphenol hydroxylase-like FAD-dependent oxidoreductase
MACRAGSTPATGHLRVGLVETSVVAPLHPLPPTPDLRVVSVNPASARLLQAVGAWDAIVNARVAPFYSMKVHRRTAPSLASWQEKLTPSTRLWAGVGHERQGFDKLQTQ